MIASRNKQFEKALDEVLRFVRQLKEYALNLQKEVQQLRLRTIEEIKSVQPGSLNTKHRGGNRRNLWSRDRDYTK